MSYWAVEGMFGDCTLCRDVYPLTQTHFLKALYASEWGRVQLKSILQGLESEYDRLLATNDSLEKKLARVDPSHKQSGPGSKKDW